MIPSIKYEILKNNFNGFMGSLHFCLGLSRVFRHTNYRRTQQSNLMVSSHLRKISFFRVGGSEELTNGWNLLLSKQCLEKFYYTDPQPFGYQKAIGLPPCSSTNKNKPEGNFSHAFHHYLRKYQRALKLSLHLLLDSYFQMQIEVFLVIQWEVILAD